jgi:endonuclease YncB( thermonuclease family)
VTGTRITVRLIGIDAPETVEPVECGGKQADAAMRKLVLDRHCDGNFHRAR